MLSAILQAVALAVMGLIAMGRRVGDFHAVKVTVPQNSDIVPGTWYRLDGFIGPAMERVVTGAGETSVVALEIGPYEYETSQITVADAFGLGDDVYFNDADDTFRSLPHGTAPGVGFENAYLVGRVTTAKDGNNVVWFGRTNFDS